MYEQRIDLSQGTVDLLSFRILSLGISARLGHVRARSTDLRRALRIQQGSLYPALDRLERRGWIKAHWGTSENNRRAKYYELTKSGRRQLELETASWNNLTTAMAQVLGTA